MQTAADVKPIPGGTFFASPKGGGPMSRVERDDRSEQKRDAEQRQRTEHRDPVDRTPSKAEGDEQTVDEALRNEE
jgi:hypothetical protein